MEKGNLPLLTKTPKEVVMSQIFLNSIRELQINAEVFSTIEAITNFIEKNSK